MVKPKESIFSFPAIASIGQFAAQSITAYASYQYQAAEAKRQTAETQRQFWIQYAAQNQENYRNYEYQLNSWYRETDYVEKRRQYEQQLAEQQATYKGAVATAATKNFEKQLSDIEGRFYEEEAKETIDLENIRAQSIAAGAKKAAGGQVGRTVERLQNQYNQQYLANLSNRQITRNFRVADKLRMTEAANVARENTSNQVQYYTPQPIADPIKPLAPLPITPVESAAVSGPSATALTMQIGTAAFNAYQNYKSMLPEAPKEVVPRSFYSGATPATNVFQNEQAASLLPQQ
jgi:hypothetical protein